ncbi:MAG TPA: hypothetical protein VGQ88_11110 [Burkholderiales bacterium]|nr:hypothetical protein [Burkholderiales bacterium]
MAYRICRLFTVLLFASLAGALPSTHAASSSDQTMPAQDQRAKPMKKKEPMAGEMKKDGMMKEDVSKAAEKWDQKMELSKNKNPK